MLDYIIRRLLLMIPTLLGVVAVVFFVMALAPGGFGGVLLSAEGAQAQGEEAKRIQQYFKRRYGLDQPVIVQFGRWLNQVSPIGFMMSADLKRDRSLFEAIEHLAKQWWPDFDDRDLALLVATTIDMAAYTGELPHDMLVRLEQETKDPASAPRLFALIDADPDQRFFEQLVVRSAKDPEAMQAELLSRLAFETTGRNRVLFHRPILKAPDLGTSLRGRAVGELLRETVPVTLLLNVITIPLIYVIAILSGTYAARYRGSTFDIGSGVLLLGLWSIPVIWAGVLLIGYFANSQHLQWFPTAGLHDLRADDMRFLPRVGAMGFERGWLLDLIWHLALPVFCLTYGGFAVLSKLMRGTILDNLGLDYVRTARAKGVNEHDVLFRHVFRNSLLPLITVAVAIIPSLLVGSVVVETIFSIPGMGRLGVEAAFQKDREVVMGTTLIAAILSLASQLLRDVCYAIADPRVSYE